MAKKKQGYGFAPATQGYGFAPATPGKAKKGAAQAGSVTVPRQAVQSVLAPSKQPALPPPPAPIPVDPNIESQRIAAGRALSVFEGNLPYEQGQLAQNYGYNQLGQRDYSNPYSQAALLQESYNRSKRGTTNSYAAQGQLYSGAYGRMQGENDRNYSISSDQLQRAASGAYQGLATDAINQFSNYGSGVSDAQWQELLKALGVSSG